MTHEFSQAPQEFGPGLVDCHQQSNFNLFEMQIKPELRCAIEDSGEDVDMEYMMEMSFECDNGSDAVCIYFTVLFVGYSLAPRICLLALCLPVNLTTVTFFI